MASHGERERKEAEVLGAGNVKFCGPVNVKLIGIELDEQRACAVDGVLGAGLLVKHRAIAEGDRVTKPSHAPHLRASALLAGWPAVLANLCGSQQTHPQQVCAAQTDPRASATPWWS